MVKYWNADRIRRVKERRERALERHRLRAEENAERARTFTPGDARKNVPLVLEALAKPILRKMIARLISGGAMSLSKLCDPFGITPPAAQKHLHRLERAGIVTTHKRGRIRFCIYNPESLAELSRSIGSKGVASFLGR